jgi:Xaa-Pro aminopeptidase
VTDLIEDDAVLAAKLLDAQAKAVVFLDFGPILTEWEADLGRTFVIGDDPVRRRRCTALTDVCAPG